MLKVDRFMRGIYIYIRSTKQSCSDCQQAKLYFCVDWRQNTEILRFAQVSAISHALVTGSERKSFFSEQESQFCY